MNWKLVHAVGLGAALLTASLLLSRVHPFGDASLFAGSRSDASASTAELPAGVRAVLMNKCADCHGRGLRPPLYGHLAPASWIMERHVIRARAAFDVMSWKQYPPDEQEALRNQIALQARTRRMPPLQYVAIHRGARLTTSEIFLLEDWAARAAEPARPAASVAAGEGDSARGKLVFEKRCAGCHALATNREGPRLQDVYGRNAASVSGFAYSDALRKTHITWNDETLSQWLSDPDAMVPGNNMSFRVIRPGERADVIRYLRQQSGR